MPIPRLLLTCCLWLLALATAHAVDVDRAAGRISLNGAVSYLADPSGKLTLADVQRSDATWLPNNSDRPLNFGYSGHTYWLRLVLTARQDAEWNLAVQYPLLDHIELFQPHHPMQLSGDAVPFTERAIPHREPQFRVPLRAGERTTLYLRVYTNNSCTIPLLLRTPEALAQDDYHTQGLLGVLFGVMLALFLYNLLLYLSLRDRTYLFYVLYVGAISLFSLTMTGWGGQYLWPLAPDWNNDAPVALLYTSLVCCFLFTHCFLDTRSQAPRLDRLLQGLTGISVLGALAILAGGPYRPLAVGATLLALIGCLTMLTAGVVVWRRGFRPARYFLMAWAVFLLAGMLTALRAFNVLPTGFFTLYGVQIGVFLEALVLSFALADRINRLKAEKAALQEEALQLARAHEADLTRKVEERTAALAAANRDLAQSVTALAALNSEKNEILGIAAHDLKNPLSGIQLGAENLRDYHDRMEPQDLLETAESITSATRRMMQIITNLLNIDAIESGKTHLAIEVVDIAGIAHAVVKDYQPRAQAKQIELAFAAEAHPAAASVDPGALTEVLDNLISNAIKYSPPGRRVDVEVKRAADRVVCRVRDQGPGFSDEDKSRLFGKFARLSAKPTGGESSTGLGLSIVKRLVEAMRGEIRCISSPGQGAEFVVELPALAG